MKGRFNSTGHRLTTWCYETYGFTSIENHVIFSCILVT